MKKALFLLSLVLCLALPAHAYVSYFHIRAMSATVAGDYDENWNFNATSYTAYFYDDGVRQLVRIYCPAGGCGSIVGANCLDADGEVLDQGRLQASTVTVMEHADCQ